MEEKKNILTYEGLKKYEDELHELKVVKRKEVAEKIKEAREQGDLSENAEYDAAKDEQRDIEARIETLEKILKNAEVVVEEDVDLNKISIGCKVKIQRNNGEKEYVFNRDCETNEFFSEKIKENLIIHIGEVLVYSFHNERLTKYPIKKFREKFWDIKN